MKNPIIQLSMRGTIWKVKKAYVMQSLQTPAKSRRQQKLKNPILLLHAARWKLPRKTIIKHRAMTMTAFSSMKTNPSVKHRQDPMFHQQCSSMTAPMFHHQSFESSQHRRRRQPNRRISTSVTKQTFKVKQLPGKAVELIATFLVFFMKIELNFLVYCSAFPSKFSRVLFYVYRDCASIKLLKPNILHERWKRHTRDENEMISVGNRICGIWWYSEDKSVAGSLNMKYSPDALHDTWIMKWVIKVR